MTVARPRRGAARTALTAALIAALAGTLPACTTTFTTARPAEYTFLREAAARYQADLLLLFRSSCRTFERYRLFEQDQARAFCAVESVMLDVRTGLVPFVATARAITISTSRKQT